MHPGLRLGEQRLELKPAELISWKRRWQQPDYGVSLQPARPACALPSPADQRLMQSSCLFPSLFLHPPIHIKHTHLQSWRQSSWILTSSYWHEWRRPNKSQIIGPHMLSRHLHKVKQVCWEISKLHWTGNRLCLNQHLVLLLCTVAYSVGVCGEQLWCSGVTSSSINTTFLPWKKMSHHCTLTLAAL